MIADPWRYGVSNDMTERRQPWLSPDDTVEALEILQDAAQCMRNTAEFGSMRKELRQKLEQQAEAVEEFLRRARRPVIDSAIMLAIDALAREKKTDSITQVVEALESFVSAYNRRK